MKKICFLIFVFSLTQLLYCQSNDQEMEREAGRDILEKLQSEMGQPLPSNADSIGDNFYQIVISEEGNQLFSELFYTRNDKIDGHGFGFVSQYQDIAMALYKTYLISLNAFIGNYAEQQDGITWKIENGEITLISKSDNGTWGVVIMMYSIQAIQKKEKQKSGENEIVDQDKIIDQEDEKMKPIEIIDQNELKDQSKVINQTSIIDTESTTELSEAMEQKSNNNNNNTNTNTRENINLSLLGGISFQAKPILDYNMKYYCFPKFFMILQGGSTASGINSDKIASESILSEGSIGIGGSIKPLKSYPMNIFGYFSTGVAYVKLNDEYIIDNKYVNFCFYPMLRACLGIDFPIGSIFYFSMQNCFDYLFGHGFNDHISAGFTLKF